MAEQAVCPEDTTHGHMRWGRANIEWERGFTKCRLPLTTRLTNVPAYVCDPCARQGRNTYRLSPKFDAALTTRLLSPVAKSLGSSLSGFDFELPVLELDFGSHRNGGHHWDSTGATFVLKEPRRGLAQVVLPDSTRRDLDTVLALSRKRELVFDRWGMGEALGGLTHFSANFYGPSGTGKSLAAEALARELGMKILTVSYAQLESKFVGETPKNIERVFDLAEAEKALLFFDEADSFLGKRVTDVRQSADYAVNVSRSVMLMRLEQFQGMVVFATNLPQNYDAAFARRLPLAVPFRLPDSADLREAIWALHLPTALPLAGDVDLRQLAEEFQELSGGDIRNAVLMAVLEEAAQPTPDDQKAVCQDGFRQSMRQVLAAKETMAGPAVPGPGQQFVLQQGSPCAGDPSPQTGDDGQSE
jgi:hypothetical protein